MMCFLQLPDTLARFCSANYSTKNIAPEWRSKHRLIRSAAKKTGTHEERGNDRERHKHNVYIHDLEHRVRNLTERPEDERGEPRDDRDRAARKETEARLFEDARIAEPDAREPSERPQMYRVKDRAVQRNDGNDGHLGKKLRRFHVARGVLKEQGDS